MMPKLRPVKEQAPKASGLFEQSDPERDLTAGLSAEEQDAIKAPQEETQAQAKVAEPAVDELRKQIEALKRSEAEQRRRLEQAEREREEARKEARERGTEAEKIRTEAVQSRAEFIGKAIEKETEAAEAAERAFQAALAEGDAVAAAKAQRRLAQAEAQLVTLRNGKEAIEAEIKEAKEAPKKEEQHQAQPQQQTIEQVIDSWNVPAVAKTWLKAHQEYVTDPRKNAQIQYLHHEVVAEGHSAYSDPYFESLETRLGLRTSDSEDGRSSMVSAPVSRQVPDNKGQRQSGTITLTPAQREAAKASGVTEAEYAKQLVKLRQLKEEGSYGEQR